MRSQNYWEILQWGTSWGYNKNVSILNRRFALRIALVSYFKMFVFFLRGMLNLTKNTEAFRSPLKVVQFIQRFKMQKVCNSKQKFWQANWSDYTYIIVQIHQPNRSEFTCSNSSTKSVRIYLSRSVDQNSQHILTYLSKFIGQIGKNILIYLSKSVGKNSQNLLVQILQPNRSENNCSNPTHKLIRI